MCDACVIDSVRRSMLSRRSVLAGAASALAAAAVAGPALAQSAAPTAAPTIASSPGAAAVSPERVLALRDLTHDLYPEFPTFFGTPGFAMEQKFRYAESGLNLFELTVNEHTGTHFDAPLHFSADGQSVNEVPVENLMAPLVVIDIAARAEGDADAMLTPDDVAAWISAHGELPPRACVALHSGWARHLDTPRFRNADADGAMHFPGFHPETAAMLIEADAVGIASDTLSLDNGASKDFAVHKAWLPTNRWGIECIAALDTLPASGATIIVGAPKHRGGTGGPSRVLALV